MSEQVYKVKYDFEFGDFSKDEIMKNGSGGCEAVIVHSILYPEDGSYSHLLISKDGRNQGELDGNELFKAWMMMGATIAKNKTMSEGKRDFCQTVVDAFWESMKV